MLRDVNPTMVIRCDAKTGILFRVRMSSDEWPVNASRNALIFGGKSSCSRPTGNLVSPRQ
jgi:hypothetical protein